MSTIDFLSASSNIKSYDSGGQGRFVLTNNSTDTLKVFWIDRDGNLQQYGNIGPNGVYTQLSTSTTHAWLVQNDSGSIAFKFYPTTYGNISVTSTGETFTPFEEKTVHTTLGDWNTYQGYGLVNIAKSLGIDDVGYTLPISGKTNNLALDLISAPSAWKAGYTGAGVKVAVIDSGIATNGEIAGKIVGGYDFLDNDSDPTPAAGSYRDHSLGVASIIAATHDIKSGPDTSGVAPDAQLLNVRVSGPNGGNDHSMSLGIKWSVDNGAKVICMPLQNNSPVYSNELHDAIKYAYDHNVVTVIIGGNFSSYGATGPALAAKEGICIAVGNYDVASATPFNSSNLPGDNPFPWVMAPSTGYVPNADGGYTYWSDGGTSFAGPYVAGLAALLIQQSPNADAKTIINKIIAGASGGHSTISVSGDAGNNVLTSSNSAELFDGGAGLDTVVYHGLNTGFKVQASGSDFTVTDKATGVTDTLHNVERIKFDDEIVAVDTGADGHAGMIFRLYETCFNRVPDLDGFGYWMKQLDGGISMNTIASSFIGSAEFKQRYGDNVSDSTFILNLYHNVLHREPDAAGFKWHVDNLSHGGTREQEVVAFTNSAENVANLVGVMQNGVAFHEFIG